MPYKASGTPYVNEEFKYNKRNRPWISIKFNSAADTLAVRKYFYDNNDRLTERHYTYGSVNPSPGDKPEIEHYYYDSQGRISRIEEEGGSAGRVLQTYAYGPSSVLVNFKYVDAGTAFKNSFIKDQRGNYTRTLAEVVIGQFYIVEWGDFDNSPSPFSFTHIKPALYFEEAGFRASSNNPGWHRWQYGSQVIYQKLTNTYNEDSMLIRKQTGTYSIDSFQYVKVKKVN